MERRDAVFLLALFGGGGYLAYSHWDEIVAKLGLDDLNPGRIKAIELCKQHFHFDRYRPNGVVIHERMSSGEIRGNAEPWLAQRIRNERFLVVCSFRDDEKEHHRNFEVDIGTGEVIDRGETPTCPIAAPPR